MIEFHLYDNESLSSHECYIFTPYIIKKFLIFFIFIAHQIIFVNLITIGIDFIILSVILYIYF